MDDPPRSGGGQALHSLREVDRTAAGRKKCDASSETAPSIYAITELHSCMA